MLSYELMWYAYPGSMTFCGRTYPAPKSPIMDKFFRRVHLSSFPHRFLVCKLLLSMKITIKLHVG